VSTDVEPAADDVDVEDRLSATAVLAHGVALGTRQTVTSFMATWASQIGITVAFLLVWASFVFVAPDTFQRSNIYVSYAQTMPYFGLTALMLTMVIASGDIDLSFPSTMALAMTGFVGVERSTGNVGLAIVTAVAVGAAAGLFNGLVVTAFGIPALVVTIGTQYLFRGLTLALVSGESYALVGVRESYGYRMLVGEVGISRQTVGALGLVVIVVVVVDQLRPRAVPLATRARVARGALAAGAVLQLLRFWAGDGPSIGIPAQFVWFVALAVVAWLLLYRHRLGQNAHVIGDNRQAAQLMGIPIQRTRVMLFMLTGMAAALAGVMNSLDVANFYPTMGEGFLLPALAAVFVGGTSVFGGRASLWGTVLGVFMIGGIDAGIVAAEAEAYWVQLIYGAIILVAICIHAVLQRRFDR
jgi:simple sugar transport system permease protein